MTEMMIVSMIKIIGSVIDYKNSGGRPPLFLLVSGVYVYAKYGGVYSISCSRLSNSSELKNSPSDISRPSHKILIVAIETL